MSLLATPLTRAKIDSSTSDSADAPTVWLITAYRAGERQQMLALAEALGWPYVIKEISRRNLAWRTNLFRGSDLSGIDVAGSSPLEPPWPDLVISAGMRNEPVCRWIRAQSGGLTRIVHVGRPWARLENFDLVITTPQYRLVERANVLQNSTTLHRVSEERLEQESSKWTAGLDIAKPYIAVIVGGDSGPYTFGRKAAQRLARQATAMAEKLGASLLVTTSARTSSAATQELSESIRVPMQIYRWRKGDDANPYFGFLALAERIIVTGDSISMLTEACATRKPVYMFDLGVGDDAMRPDSEAENSGNDFRLTGLLYRWLMRIGPRRLSRDIQLVHQRLIEDGRAVWLGETFPDQAPPALPDLNRAVRRVRGLFSMDG